MHLLFLKYFILYQGNPHSLQSHDRVVKLCWELQKTRRQHVPSYFSTMHVMLKKVSSTDYEIRKFSLVWLPPDTESISIRYGPPLGNENRKRNTELAPNIYFGWYKRAYRLQAGPWHHERLGVSLPDGRRMCNDPRPPSWCCATGSPSPLGSGVGGGPPLASPGPSGYAIHQVQ